MVGRIRVLRYDRSRGGRLMNSDVQELYTETVRQWPISERLRLAVLILDDLANIVTVSPARQSLSEAQRKVALDELLRHAGDVSSGNPRSADNEQIDEDLARECGITAALMTDRHFKQEGFVRLLPS
ncbi:MAG: hypothetical protein ACREA2_02800 [Blastocatellia bacterium]